MPWAWRWPSARWPPTFNRPGHNIIDHHTYVFRRRRLHDGGHLARGGLVRRHAATGQAHCWCTTTTAFPSTARWWAGSATTRPNASRPMAGMYSPAWTARTAPPLRPPWPQRARRPTSPSLICAKTVIGWGAPNKQGTAAMHGEAMGVEEIAAARKNLGWTSPPFEIPADIRAAWDQARQGRARPSRNGARRYRGLQSRVSGAWPRNWNGAWRAICRRASTDRECLRRTDAGRGQGAGHAAVLAGGA